MEYNHAMDAEDSSNEVYDESSLISVEKEGCARLM